MFGRARRQDDRADAQPSGPVAPVDSFAAGPFRAEWAPRPYGRRGKTRPFVRLTTLGVDAEFHVDDLRKTAQRKQGVAEAMSQPLTFLCWPESAAPTSVAADHLLGVPQDALALLVEPMTGPPAHVLDRPTIDRFAEWLDTLPA